MRSARRLIVAVLCLAAVDPFVPGALARAERHRYDAARAFRFANSDLFGLGPLVSYLREHPRGDRPRALFLGNSVMYGYQLDAAEAVPARFGERHPEIQVFNGAVNGFDLGSNYLVAKAAIDAVDAVYVMRGTASANPLLASLIPVDPADAETFHLMRPDPIERRLQSVAGVWRLYASTYRLQAAWFGTSTRESLHLLTRPPITRTFTPEPANAVGRATWRAAAPPSGERRAELRRRDETMWAFAELAAGRRKRVVFVNLGAPTGAMGETELADFNAAFAPYAEVVGVTIPPALLFDGRHLTPAGAVRVAEALP